MKLTNRQRKAKVRKRMQKENRRINQRKGLHLKHTQPIFITKFKQKKMRRILNEVARMKKIAGIISESQGINPIQIAKLVKADFDSSGMVDPISKLNQSGATLEDFEAAIPLLQKMRIQVKPQPERNPGEQEWIVQYGDQQQLYMYDGEWFGEYGGYAMDEGADMATSEEITMEGDEVTEARGASPETVADIVKAGFDYGYKLPDGSIGQVDPIREFNKLGVTPEDLTAAAPIIQRMGVKGGERPQANEGERTWAFKFGSKRGTYLYDEYQNEWYGDSY